MRTPQQWSEPERSATRCSSTTSCYVDRRLWTAVIVSEWYTWARARAAGAITLESLCVSHVLPPTTPHKRCSSFPTIGLVRPCDARRARARSSATPISAHPRRGHTSRCGARPADAWRATSPEPPEPRSASERAGRMGTPARDRPLLPWLSDDGFSTHPRQGHIRFLYSKNFLKITPDGRDGAVPGYASGIKHHS